jgi:glycosyltransferase involved in cell wall biosynthesis
MHIVFTIANNSSVPYFNWFAEKASKENIHTFSFVALYKEKPQMFEDVERYGWKCYWIKFNPEKRKTGMIKSFVRLFRLYKKIKPDVVHSHLFDDALPSLLAARLAGVKTRIITKQDATFHYYYAPKWVKADRFNNWNATIIHSVATRNYEFIINIEKANVNKVKIVRNGFPVNKLSVYSEKDKNEFIDKYALKNKYVIGTVARLIEWKGHKFIIEAAKEIKNQIDNVVFLFVGTGDESYINKLKTLIKENNLENIFLFTGWVERKYMPALYSCMDLYLHPAVNEPFGFAIAEAMINKIPIIATRTGSTDLMVHKREGYIINEKKYEDIVEGVMFYYNNKSMIKTIVNNAYSYVYKNLSFDRMYNEHILLYEGKI